MNPRKMLLIAQVAHEVNKTYCETVCDDYSQPDWNDAPDWQVESAVNGVIFTKDNMDATPEQSHENWLAQKADEGWVYGEVKDAEKKTHPCMLPYDELPAEQQVKDALYQTVVKTLLKGMFGRNGVKEVSIESFEAEGDTMQLGIDVQGMTKLEAISYLRLGEHNLINDLAK